MTSISELNSLNNNRINQIQFDFQLLYQIIDILGQFENNYNKRFNFSKMAKCLKIPNLKTDDIIELLLTFQDLFESVFKKHHIKKTILNNQIYLTVKKKEEHSFVSNIEVPKTIKISNEHFKLFNDIIYIFKYVNRGKGFDVSKNETELIENLKELKSEHPYLFYGNGVTYPTKLGLELGELIISYSKSSQNIKNLTIGNYTFVVDKNG